VPSQPNREPPAHQLDHGLRSRGNAILSKLDENRPGRCWRGLCLWGVVSENSTLELGVVQTSGSGDAIVPSSLAATTAAASYSASAIRFPLQLSREVVQIACDSTRPCSRVNGSRNDNPYPTGERVGVKAGKTPYVCYDLNDYSIPHTHVGRVLPVLVSPQRVRVLEGATVIATHPRSYDKGAQIEDRAHIAAPTAAYQICTVLLSH
jgi:hypothetical protein